MSSKAPKTQLPNRQALLRSRPTPVIKKKPTDPRPYWIGALGGLLSGLIGAYLFKRAADEAGKDGRVTPIETGQLFGLALALITVLRHIAELANPPNGKKR